MCAYVRYWPERGVALNVCFSSEIGLVFFGCRNVLGCLAVTLILQSATKFIQILCWLQRGNEACPSLTPSIQYHTAVWATRKKYLKDPTFSGGVGCGRVWIVLFSEVTHLRTMSIQFCCRLLIVSPPLPPPTLKSPRSPHSSSVIKSKMAATTMHMPCWWAPIRAKLPGWYGCAHA